MKSPIINLVASFILFTAAQATEKPPVHLWTCRQPFEQKVFIENKGQYEIKDVAVVSDILFGARQDGLQYYFTKDGIWVKHFNRVERTEKEREEFETLLGEKHNGRKGENDPIVKYKFVESFYRMEFVGAGANTEVISSFEEPQWYNFNVDNKFTARAHGFKKITYKNLYPGIDAEFVFPEDKQGFKYTLIVSPGANASLIRIRYPQSKKTELMPEGNIVSSSGFGDFTDHAPTAFETSTMKQVDCSFSHKNGVTEFTVGQFNTRNGLTIDPWTSTPAYTGSTSAYDVDYDKYGNCYAYGGNTPFQLIKFSPAGVLLWTYTNGFATNGGGFYYGDFAVNRLSGSAFLVDGFNSSGAYAEKVSLSGGLNTGSTNNSFFQEMWRVTFSRCTNQIVIGGGGTTSPSFTGATFDTSLTGINITNVINCPTGLHDMWGCTVDNIGNAYFFTAKTQVGVLGYDNYLFKVPTPALAPITYSVPTTYNFVEVASVSYAGSSSPNGFNGTAMSSANLYTWDSYVLQRWNSATGVIVGSATINGASLSTMNYGGLAADDCDHLYVGSNNSILKYNGLTMTQTGTIGMSGTVFDCAISTPNILYSCGNGFVTATQINIPPCSVLVPTNQIVNGNCANPVGSVTVTVTGGTAPYTINWNSTPPQSGPILANVPTGTYIATIKDNSCNQQLTNDTVVITNSGTITFTATTTNINCHGAATGAVTLNIVNTGTTTPTFLWNSGATTQSISNLTAGVYSVAINEGNGCIAPLTTTVTQPAQLSYTLHPVSAACNGDTSGVSISLSGGTPGHLGGNPSYTVNWSPPTATGMAVHGLLAGNYGGIISDSLNCTVTFTTAILQPPPVVPSFSVSSSCLGTPVMFTNHSTGGPFTAITWLFGDGASISNQTNAVHGYYTAGNYNATLTIIDSVGCSGSITDSVHVYYPPNANFSGDTLTGCAPVTVNFTDHSTCLSGNIASWSWSFGNGNTSLSQTNGPQTYSNTSSTVWALYSASLTVVSSKGCSSSVIKNDFIYVYPIPKASFYYAAQDGSQLDVLNNVVSFYNTSLGGTHFWWVFGDSIASPASSDSSHLMNPTHQYHNSNADTYTVSLLITSNYGCRDSTTDVILIHPTFSFYMPSAFSPDGNGLNDDFRGSGIGIESNTFQMVVFDRWGNMVFTSNNLDIGWDGRMLGRGDVLQTDVYVWKAEFKDLSGVNHKYQGAVSLLK